MDVPGGTGEVSDGSSSDMGSTFTRRHGKSHPLDEGRHTVYSPNLPESNSPPGAPFWDTAKTGNYSGLVGLVKDAPSSVNPSVAFVNKALIDSAPPKMVLVETLDQNSNGALDALRVTYSETVAIVDTGGVSDALPGLAVSGYTIPTGDYTNAGAAFTKAEYEKWRKVIIDGHITLD